MSTLIVYYSYTGNSGLVAGVLQNALKAETLELKLADDGERKGLAKYLWGGKMVFSRAKPPLKPYRADWENYDLIIIGGPVWAGSPAPALLTFLDETGIRGKKVVLFCCHRGGKGKALDKLKALLPGNTFAGERDFVIPRGANQSEALESVRAWAKTLGD
ncbi:MAG: NAD(P)H-dependent oxidoreductase [Treponema sp.]|jgi:flavodoxin|nr:NAD(P)H-dependent oxidoreductase [Treponema sp.]